MINPVPKRQRKTFHRWGASVMLLASWHAHAADVSDIDGLIREAVQTHPLVNAAQAEQKATLQDLNVAELAVFPAPSVQSGYDPANGMTTSLVVRQPLWTGGKVSADIRQAYYSDQAASANISDQRNQVAKNTIAAWQSYVEASGLQQIYAQTIQDLTTFQQMMQRRVNQGVSARIELDLVNNRMLQARNQYDGALEQKRIAQARLQQIVGQNLSDDQILSIQRMTDLLSMAQQQAQLLEDQVFRTQGVRHPSVLKAQLQTLSAQAQADAKLAQRYPTVYAQYQYNYLHDSHRHDSVLGLGLAFDPGSGFANFASSRATQARVESYRQNEEATRRTVLENVQIQFQQLMSARSRATALRSAVDGARIVTESYQRQFIAGRKSWLEVLNAVREQSDYQAQLIQNNAALLASFYNLKVDLGGMPWQNPTTIETIAPAPQPLDRVRGEYRIARDRINTYFNQPAKPDAPASMIQPETPAPEMLPAPVPVMAPASVAVTKKTSKPAVKRAKTKTTTQVRKSQPKRP